MTGGIAKVVIFSFTERGTKQNRYIYRKLKMQGYICEGYAPAKYVMGEEGGVKQLPKKKEDLIRERWGKWAFLFIGAAGIAVRYIAPYVKDKFTDSAVVVADEAGQYVIPLLSGHVGGAAELADQIANLLGAVSVHTTATDVRKKFAADICVSDQEGNTLFIVECKTYGREYEKEYKNIVNDGGQLFSYWQQERSCKFLVLYASKYEGKQIKWDTESIDCSDDANIVALSQKDDSIKLFKNAHTVSELYSVWDETYEKRFSGDVIFRDDSSAY